MSRSDTFGGIVPTAFGIFRTFLAAATWGSLALAWWTKDLRWMAACGAFGTLWWLADALFEWVFAPLGDFLAGLLQGGVDLPPANTRPTVEDTVRLLEHHIEVNAARSVQIQSALRLSDIYRALYHDDVRAQAILGIVRSRFPDAEELRRET